jgi:hypothetical protein
MNMGGMDGIKPAAKSAPDPMLPLSCSPFAMRRRTRSRHWMRARTTCDEAILGSGIDGQSARLRRLPNGPENSPQGDQSGRL